jgi:hypothetical protein
MRIRLAMWIATFVVVCICLSTLLRTIDRTLFRSGGPAPRQSATSQIPSAPPAPVSIQQARATPKPPPATPRDQHWEAMKLLTEGAVAQQEAVGHFQRWQTEIEPLRQDRSGDVVAANKELVEKLAYVVRQERMSQTEIQVVGEQIATLRKRLEAVASQVEPEALTAHEMIEIRDLHTKATLARRQWENAIKQASAIVMKAQLDVNPVAQPTLQQELEQIEAKKTLEELDQKITRQENAAAEPALEASAEAPVAAIDPELRAKALSTEVKSTLAPFLEPRSIQPSLAGNFSIRFNKTFEPQPMSLGKLMSIGVLDESVLGLKKLALLGGNRKLPEPRWSIASQPGNWSSADEEFLKKAQQMLRDYGEVLVSEGLLSP